MSTPGKRENGNTTSLTAKPLIRGSIRLKSVSFPPAIISAAIDAMGDPTALATKGTVRDALGLTSIRYTVPSFTANWMFMSPTTFSANASFSV